MKNRSQTNNNLKTLNAMEETLNPSPVIAYFSMEVGIEPRMPTYSSGLGVLAGDTLKAAADLNIPLVGVA